MHILFTQPWMIIVCVCVCVYACMCVCMCVCVYMCMCIYKQIGDIIIKIDGKDATMENYEMSLLGCDVPGSKVLITVQKPQVCICVWL